MKKKLFSAFISLFLVSNAQQAAAVPALERAALLSIYHNTGGDQWVNNTNWSGAIGTECEWYGVHCVGGHVFRVDLKNNGLVGKIPPAIYQLPRIKTLNLSSNKLNGLLPIQLGQLSQLSLLELNNNELSGAIPPILGELSELKRLSLNNNNLNGTIPRSLGQLSQLTSLSLSNNNLTGNIPTELGALSALKGLWISSNWLRGSVPSELAQLSQLTVLSLGQNLLDGSLPSEFLQLTNLSSFSSISTCTTVDDLELTTFFRTIRANIAENCSEDKTLLISSVARYDFAGEQMLHIEEVVVNGHIYSAQLKNFGNNQFAIINTVELTESTHPTPATYSVDTLLLKLPVVHAPSLNTYKVQMKNAGNAVFSVIEATPIAVQ